MSTILAGWASNSKWAVYGAMREACQMVSYEIPLGLSIITGVLVAGTLNMVELAYLQGAGMHDWFLFHNPFMLVAFLVYFIASLASNKRAPFDLPESESELVAGYLTEYSGLRWSLFFLGEYNAMFVVGAIQAALFLGGWNSPLGVLDPVYAAVGYDPLAAGQAYATGALAAASTLADKASAINAASAQLHGESGSLGAMGLIVVNLYGVAWFAAKAMGTIFIQIWVRWTLPRIRIDQVLHTCVKVLLPISLACLVLTMFWVAAESWGAKGPVAGAGADAVQLPVHWRHLLGDAPA
jgi:NADH-quinone oxidoreductase subunit H